MANNRGRNDRRRRGEPPRDVSGMVPPYSQEAETAVLGSVLLNNDCLAEVVASLPETDFYVEANRRIFEAIKDLHRKQTPIDFLTLSEELKEKGDLEKIGGVMALTKITDAVATIANVDYYIGIVREKALVRRMIYAAQEIVATGLMNRFDTGDEFVAEARSAIVKAAASGMLDNEGPTHISQGVKNAFNRLEKGQPAAKFLDLGFGGLRVRKGILSVIGGRPSNMKSTVALNGTINLGRQENHGLVFNLEDTEDTLWNRALSSAGNVQLDRIEEGRCKGDDWPRLIDGANKLSQLPIWCYDRVGVSSEWIYNKCALHMERHGLDFAILDYLQLMKDDGEGRYDRFSNSVEGLVKVARDFGIALIVLSQIKRPTNLAPGVIPNPPTENELKETGAIEQAAKTIFLTHYASHYDKDGTNPNCNPNEIRIETSKQSNGPVGVRMCSTYPDRMWIGDFPTSGGGYEETY